MIKDTAYWREWELAWERQNPLTLEQALAIYQAMLDEARELGVLPPKDRLEGIELKIKIAKAVNAV